MSDVEAKLQELELRVAILERENTKLLERLLVMEKTGQSVPVPHITGSSTPNIKKAGPEMTIPDQRVAPDQRTQDRLPTGERRAPQGYPGQTKVTVIPPKPAQQPMAKPKPAVSGLAAELMEARIGGTWLNRIGIVAFIFGLAFFLKYSFDNNWIGPAGRVVIGILAGLGLLAGGEKGQRKGYRIFAQGLTGGGIAALYFAIFAAFSFYHLLGQIPAFGIMILVTTTAVLLAVRYDSYAIAVLGIVGGFLTPFFLNTGVPNEVGLFSYIALLDCGILALAYFKKWRSINIVAFAFTMLILALWIAGGDSEKAVWTNQLFYTLFFAIFACLAIFYNVVHRVKTQSDDLFLIIANASVFFFISYNNLIPHYDRYIGFLPFTMALIYFVIGYLAWLRNKEDRLLVLSLWGISVVFLTLTMPLQLHGKWITIAWAVESVLLLGLGCYSKSPSTRQSALGVMGIALFRLYFDARVYLDSFYYPPTRPFWPLANIHMLPFAACIAGVFAISYLYYRYRGALQEDEKTWWHGFLVLGTILTAAYLSLETYYFCGQWGKQVFGREFAVPETRALSIAVVWFISSIALTWLGGRNSSLGSRLLGLLCSVAGLMLIFGPGAAFYFESEARYWPLLSWHSVPYLAGIAAALYIARKSWRQDTQGTMEEFVPVGAVIAANLAALAYLSLEVFGFYRGWGEHLGLADNLRNAIQMTLSVVWTVYAIGLIAAGFIWKNRSLRFMAIVIFAVTILKVFLFDLANLDTIYRIISFIVLGGLLVVVSFLYQRYKDRIFGQQPMQQDKGASQ